MSDTEIYRRLDNLEETDKKLSSSVTELTMDIRLMVQSMNLMQKTLEKMTSIEEKMSLRFDASERLTVETHTAFDKRITNIEGSLRVLKLIGSTLIVVLVGAASKSIFGL